MNECCVPWPHQEHHERCPVSVARRKRLRELSENPYRCTACDVPVKPDYIPGPNELSFRGPYYCEDCWTKKGN